MLRVAEAIERTDTGRQRRGNEDSSFARPPLFVVADGMGGAQAGEVASRVAVEAFAQGIPERGSAEARLAECVREANRRIHALSREEHDRAGMGTTLTAALLEDTELAIAHVGDSRAYLFREGALTRLTHDHSLVAELVRQGKLTESQAEEHPQRSIITRALGPEPSVEVDTWSYPVRAEDVLLLCSDGLTSMIGEERITEILREGGELPVVGDRLIREANEAGGRDNITVVLFRLEDAGGDGAADQPTRVESPGSATPAAPPASEAVPVSPPPDGRAPREAAATPRPSGSARPRLARTQAGRPAEATPAPRPRWVRVLAALIAVAVVLFLVLGGGYLATRQLYFIGTDSRGVVTVYRGLPYELPAGVRLYESFYVSGVPASAVPADRRSSVFNHHLRSQNDATSLVRTLELGRLVR